jgi:amino acid transporter
MGDPVSIQTSSNESSSKVPATVEKGVMDRTGSVEEATHGTTVVLSPNVDNAGYHRSLGRRQIMMMTFGAGIGTGLWVGTGQALKYGS